jgi:hypothetical protein
MTPLRRTELAAQAVAAGDGVVAVPARELLAIIGELALLRERIALDDRVAKLVSKLERLEPFISRAAAALESARGVLRQLRLVDQELAGDEFAARAQRQYGETVDELERGEE